MAAMRVVMSMQVKSAEDAEDHEANQNGHNYMTASRSLEGDHMSDRDLEDTLNGLHDYSPSLERPEPMEHILTEDGEPMLNPGAFFLQLFPQIFSFVKNSMNNFYSRVIDPGKLVFPLDSILAPKCSK